MKIEDVVHLMESWAPPAYSEEFDNVGLLVGEMKAEMKGILVSLDTTEEVIQEAIDKGCNLVVGFHPILFSGIKRITGSDYVQRTLTKAIKNDIAIYAVHTALDNHRYGVSYRLALALGIKDPMILLPYKGSIKKLHTYIPVDKAEELRLALFKIGAGSIGNYDHCSFNVLGTGTFRPMDGTKPYVGTQGEDHLEPEVQVSITYLKHQERALLEALFKAHPYEEVAYEITTLDNSNPYIGMGMVGELMEPLSHLEFLSHLKQSLTLKGVRHSRPIDRPIKKVAVLGGSGSYAISAAKAAKADAFVTADLKYHDFFQAEGAILLADVGHYESEQFTKNLLYEFLTKKMPNFAIVLSKVNTNPVNYS